MVSWGTDNAAPVGNWMTPPHVVALARRAMGGIDIDPASSAQANQIVRAKRHIAPPQDGLAEDWKGRVYLNPPYGRQQQAWLQKLWDERASGRVKQAVGVVNAQVGAKWFDIVWQADAICFWRGRIAFLASDGTPRDNPSNYTAIFYLGDNRARFQTTFKDHGHVIV